MPVPTDNPASSADDEHKGGADSANTDAASPDASEGKTDDASTSTGQDAEKSGIDIVREALGMDAPANGDGKTADPDKAAKDKATDASATDGKDNDDAAKASDKSKPAIDADERPDDAKLPFNKHPRWIERGQKLRTALTENETLKADKARFEQDVAALRPKAEASDVLVGFMNEHKLTGENLQEVLDIAALLRSDPNEARKRITTILDQLDETTGEKLPADLRKKVDDGDITVEDARELSRARADKKRAETVAAELKTESEADKVKRQTDEARKTIETTVNRRLDKLAASDVDFAKKQELLETHVVQALQARKGAPFKSVAEIEQLVDAAYKKTNDAIARFTPPKTEQRRAQTSHSNTSNPISDLPATATGLDVVKAALGIAQ